MHAATQFLVFRLVSSPAITMLLPEPTIPVTVVVVALILLTGYVAKLEKAPIKQAMFCNLTVGLFDHACNLLWSGIFPRECGSTMDKSTVRVGFFSLLDQAYPWYNRLCVWINY